MPTPYAGRHRAATSAATPRPSHPARAAFRPLSVSAVSLGLTLGLIHAATSWGDSTPANALAPSTAVQTSAAAVVAALTPPAGNASGSSPSPPPAGSAGSPRTLSAAEVIDPDTLSAADERKAHRRPTPPPPPPTPTVDPAKVWVVPVTGTTLSSPYGPRWGTIHHGIDLAGPVGLPLKAMSGGVVTFAGQQSGYGNIVQIKYWDGTVSYYGHMNAVSVKVGDAVNPGQVVGQLGNSGQSTGPHLHLEIHPGGGADVDPQPWIKAHGLTVG